MAKSARKRFRLSRPALRSRAWRMCGWMSVGLYLTVALGIAFPLPRPTLNAAGKDTTTPFPCMNSPCGCRTAEHCWRHCCCHTLAERIEWARQNHVQPPDDVLAEAKAQGIECDSPQVDSCRGDSGEGCCCRHQHSTSADNEPSACGSSSDGAAASRQARMDGIVLIKALQCQGFGADWLLSVVSLPPPQAVRWLTDWNLTAPIAFGTQLGTSFSAEPPTPPPRNAA